MTPPTSSAAVESAQIDGRVPRRLHALVIGDVRRAEFQPAIAALSRAAVVQCLPAPPDAGKPLGDDSTGPDLIVVCQSRPGQFRFAQVEPLLRRAPLARVVVIAGAWCDGDGRSGGAWPAASHIHWCSTGRLEAELALADTDECPTWGLPLTASAEERTMAAAARASSPSTCLVAICSQSRELADWLADACKDRGYSVLRLREGPHWQSHGAAAVLWDVGPWSESARAEAALLASAAGGHAPLIALVDFVRPSQVEDAVSAGVSSVLRKPCGLDELYHQLDAAIRGAGAAS